MNNQTISFSYEITNLIFIASIIAEGKAVDLRYYNMSCVLRHINSTINEAIPHRSNEYGVLADKIEERLVEIGFTRKQMLYASIDFVYNNMQMLDNVYCASGLNNPFPFTSDITAIRNVLPRSSHAHCHQFSRIVHQLKFS